MSKQLPTFVFTNYIFRGNAETGNSLPVFFYAKNKNAAQPFFAIYFLLFSKAMSQQAILVSAFVHHGLKYINGNRAHADTKWTAVNERRWNANYGVSPHTCQAIWGLMTGLSPLPNGASFYHLLWGLLFLKTYMTEAVVSGMLGVDEQTYRKWVWIIIPRIAALKPRVVSTFIFI